MIVSLLNQKGGVGQTTQALDLAGEWDRQGQRVTSIDADPRVSAPDWSQQRDREGLPRPFGVVGLACNALHRKAPEMARSADHAAIEGHPRVAGTMRSALLSADLVLIPVLPSPFDGAASAEVLTVLGEARIYHRWIAAIFVLNRCGTRTIIVRETAEGLADHHPPLFAPTIGKRVTFANATRIGWRFSEIDEAAAAALSIAALTDGRTHEDRAMSARIPKYAVASRPADAESWIKAPDVHATRGAADGGFTARVNIDITPEQRGRLKVLAFRRGVTVADKLRDLLAREFPAYPGDPS